MYALLAGLHEWTVTLCGWCKPLLWVTCCRSSCLISCWGFSSERRQICSKCKKKNKVYFLKFINQFKIQVKNGSRVSKLTQETQTNNEHHTQAANTFIRPQKQNIGSRFFFWTSLDISVYRDGPFTGNTCITVATTSCLLLRAVELKKREGLEDHFLTPEFMAVFWCRRVNLKDLYLLVPSPIQADHSPSHNPQKRRLLCVYAC